MKSLLFLAQPQMARTKVPRVRWSFEARLAVGQPRLTDAVRPRGWPAFQLSDER